MKSALSAAVMLATLPILAQAEAEYPSHEFEFLAPITGTLQAGQPQRVALPADVMAHIDETRSDLRIIDDQGHNTPYALMVRDISGLAPENFVFSIVSATQEGDIDELIIERPENIKHYEHLSFATEAHDFRRVVTVFTSQDKRTWKQHTEDTIFAMQSPVRLRHVAFDIPATDARYLKLRLSPPHTPKADAPPLNINYRGIEIFAGATGSDPIVFSEIGGTSSPQAGVRTHLSEAVLTPPPIVKNKQGLSTSLFERFNLPMSEFEIEASNAYYFREISLWASPDNKRDTWIFQEGGSVYLLPGMHSGSGALPATVGQNKYLELRINDGDNPPLDLRKITVRWATRDLYFVPAEGRSYTLYFGNPKLRTPQYDVAAMLSPHAAERLAYAELSLAAVSKNTDYAPSYTVQEQQQRREYIILVTVIGVIAVGLSYWLITLVRRSTANN